MVALLMRLVFVVLAVIIAIGFSPAALGQGAPDAIVTSFLENWKNRNYDGMYNLVAERSRNLTAFPVFETIYREADAALGLEDMTFTVRDVSIQGTSAAVTYDLTVQSGIFETIEDPGRIMRLVQAPGGWGVAWSSMDIFDGMTGAAKLQLFGQREPRANIYDRNGLPVVKQDGAVVALYVQQQEIPNQAVCLDVLANVLRRQRQDLVTLFERYNLDTVFYVGEIDADVFATREVDLRDNCLIRTAERTTRNYYRGNAVSHVTGYLGQLPADQLPQWEARGYTSGDLIGRNGIELEAEEQLAGKPARRLQIVEPAGVVIRELGATVGTPPMPVTLTIDRELQLEVAQALADAYTYAEGNWGSRNISTGAAAIVMDVHTGAILAMSSYPLFEPDIFNPDTLCCGFIAASDRIAELVGDTRTPLFNRVTQGQYSPGSIYKIITTAAAAEEHLMEPDAIFDCTHTWDGTRYGDTVGFERRDWTLTDGLDPTGPVTFSQALTSSCDPFFYEMGARLFNEVGPSTLVEYSRRMGLGSATGLDYFGTEASGQITVPNSPSEAINNAIGQGNVQVTPIQMARLVAGIANGGTVYKPYLIQKIGGVDFTPIVFEAQPEVVSEMGLSEETLEVVRKGMCDVTRDERLGTAYSAFDNAAYSVCGKTGTSQTNRYPNAWFVAYAPAEDPQIAVVVMAEQSREGSEVAAPIVRRILDFYFQQPWYGFPLWWFENEYVPLNIPEGATGG
jgi:penicillin-binding protein 2